MIVWSGVREDVAFFVRFPRYCLLTFFHNSFLHILHEKCVFGLKNCIWDAFLREYSCILREIA